jgi:hypothetical protein
MFRWPKRKSGSTDVPEGGSRPDDLRCSFCNKRQADVRKLIAGPAVFICDECVDLCVDIIADDQRLPGQPSDAPSSQPSQRVSGSVAPNMVACTLCCKAGSFNEMLPIENRGALCGACADAVEDALAQGRPAS